jgi:hypothetical protein
MVLAVGSSEASGIGVPPSVGVVVGGDPGAVVVGFVVVGPSALVVVGDPGVVVVVGVPGSVVVGVPGSVVVVGVPGIVVVVVGVPGMVVVVGVPGTVVGVGVPGMVVVTMVVVVEGGAMSAAISMASKCRLPVTPEPDPRNLTTVAEPMYPLMSKAALDAFCGPAKLTVVSVFHDVPPLPETCTVTLPDTWPWVCRR